ncbi:hypothetical protein WBS58_24995 [Bacillus albus]|uniref:hypothetical protein n=1 Tax=Bacillus TaxID=1386 RepID=UPI00301474B2
MSNYYDYNNHYDQYIYFYQNPYSRPPSSQGQSFYLVTQGDIVSHLNAGRKGHCFSGHWAGRDHTFILMGLRADGTVDIIENGQPGTVHRTDIVGLNYIGVQCPAPPPPPGGGSGSWPPGGGGGSWPPGGGGGSWPPGGGGGSWPHHCHWIQTQWGWKKVCH